MHYINANIYNSMLQNSVEINKLCIGIDTSTSQKVECTIEIRVVLATLRRVEMSKNHNELTLILVLANVFSSNSIKNANPRLQMAMEDVAGKAEQLAKAKAKDDPPPPFRKRKMQSISKFADWYPKKYAMDGKALRDK